MNATTPDLRTLPPFARLLFRELPVLAKGHPHCFTGNKKLAELLGCCEKTVRNALLALRSAGLIEVVRDYGLRTRRRIVLLWRQARESNPFVTVNKSPDSTVTFTATNGSPLNRSPEGEIKKESDGGPEPTPPSRASLPEENPDPEPMDEILVQATIMAAEDVLGPDPGLSTRVLSLAKKWGLLWVCSAFHRTGIRIKERGPIEHPMGYVIGTLKGYAAEGGPPPLRRSGGSAFA